MKRDKNMKKRIAVFFVTVLLLTTEVPGLGFTDGIKTVDNEIMAGTPEYSVNNPHVIINQVYGSGSDGYVSHSFIELYNPTNITVDMGGWSIQYRSSVSGGDTGWSKLELTSSINAHSSYLIRCSSLTDYTNKKYDITNYDMSWNKSIFNKGFSVVLLSGDNDIAGTGESVFDNTGKPVIDNYVDMLSAAGNDYYKKNKINIAGQKPPYYENSFIAEQSKKKAIRRIGFKDTDDNLSDLEEVDYSKNSMEKYLPRWSGDGEWTVNEINFSHESGFYDDVFDLYLGPRKF